MTGHPEAVPARERGLCHTTIALFTDYDAGVDAATAVSQAEVFEVFARNTETLRDLVCRAVPTLPTRRSVPAPAPTRTPSTA